MDHRLEYPFKNDHEIFIALIEDFNNSIAGLSGKMTEDHLATMEVKELLEKQKELLDKQLETLSSRIVTIEKTLLEINPEDIAQLKKTVGSHGEWIHDFKTTRHIAWVVASVGFLVIGYYLPSLVAMLMKIFPHGIGK